MENGAMAALLKLTKVCSRNEKPTKEECFLNNGFLVAYVENERCFLCSVPDRFSKTLLSCIEKFVKPKTMIYSDFWAAYKALDGHSSYFHADVNHSKNIKNPDTGVHTNNIECLWRDAKMKNKKCMERIEK